MSRLLLEIQRWHSVMSRELNITLDPDLSALSDEGVSLTILNISGLAELIRGGYNTLSLNEKRIPPSV